MKTDPNDAIEPIITANGLKKVTVSRLAQSGYLQSHGYTEGSFTGDNTVISTGLTKREWFAGLAMQAWIQNSEVMSDFEKILPDSTAIQMALGKLSLQAADALIKELNKESEG